MVTKWGLSDTLGAISYGQNEGEVFLGQAISQTRECSADTAALIDAEIRAIIDRNYERARQLLTDRIDTLHAMAAALVQYETLDSEQIDAIMNGREPPRPRDKVRPAKDDRKDRSSGSDLTNRRGARVGPPAEQH